MRVGELSWASGVPVPTIKFYLREGLLPRGRSTGPNQAEYDDTHLARLQLVRALVEVGGLSVATARDVLADVDTPGPDLDTRLGRVVGALTRAALDLDEDERRVAQARVESLAEEHGWSGASADYPARRGLADVLALLERLGATGVLSRLDRYAASATAAAAADLDALSDVADDDAVLEQAVILTVVGDLLLSTMRRVAQAAESGRRSAS